MPGFTSITGDESIMFADNASFDGTQRNGKITSDGQQWIGSDVSPHVRVGKITSLDGSVIITFGHGTIDLAVPGGGGVGGCNKLVAATKFTISGVWTKNPATNCMTVYVWSGGGGGGSGRQGATTAAGGGSGGAGGWLVYYQGNASSFGATETVTIGAGGLGGATQAGANSNGKDGAAGGFSAFGNLIGQIETSQFGTGGTTTVSTPGVAAQGTYINGNTLNMDLTAISQAKFLSGVGGLGTNTVGAPGGDIGGLSQWSCPPGGGGGAGADAAVERTAGNGGGILEFGSVTGLYLINGGAGGTESGTVNGGAGTPSTQTGGVIFAGTGGGGGGGMKSIGPGTGGVGGLPGGGGGGGGGSINGTSSGAGGNGGAGMVYVLEFA